MTTSNYSPPVIDLLYLEHKALMENTKMPDTGTALMLRYAQPPILTGNRAERRRQAAKWRKAQS